jgi:hypothetical protein
VEKQFLLKMNRESTPGVRFLQAVDDGTEEALEFAAQVSRGASLDDRTKILHHSVARLTQALSYQCRFVVPVGRVFLSTRLHWSGCCAVLVSAAGAPGWPGQAPHGGLLFRIKKNCRFL